MTRSHAFLISTSAALAAACGAAAVALAPIDGNRSGTATGFSFFATIAGAGAALTVASLADGLTARR